MIGVGCDVFLVCRTFCPFALLYLVHPGCAARMQRSHPQHGSAPIPVSYARPRSSASRPTSRMGESPPPRPIENDTSPMMAFPQVYKERVRQRRERAARELQVRNAVLSNLNDRVKLAPPRSSSSHGSPAKSKSTIATPSRPPMLLSSDSPTTSTRLAHSRRLTPIKGGTSPFLSTSRRPNTPQRPPSSLREAKYLAFVEESSKKKQFLACMRLLQNSPSAVSVGCGPATKHEVYYPGAGAVVAWVNVEEDAASEYQRARQRGVMMCHLSGNADWTNTCLPVFGPGELWNLHTCGSTGKNANPSPIPFTVSALVILGAAQAEEIVGIGTIVAAHPTIEEVHFVDMPLNAFLRDTLHRLVESNPRIQNVSWLLPPANTRSPRGRPPTLYTKGQIRLSEITGSPSAGESEVDEEEGETWCLAGSLSDEEMDGHSLCYTRPSFGGRRATIRSQAGDSPSRLPQRLSRLSHQMGAGCPPSRSCSAPTSPNEFPLQFSAPPAIVSCPPWQARLAALLQTAKPGLGPSATPLAEKWLRDLNDRLTANGRLTRKQERRENRDAALSAYIERLDDLCFNVFREMVVAERVLRTDLDELQMVERGQLYALEQRECGKALRRDQIAILLEEVAHRVEWVQGREDAFRRGLESDERTARIEIFTTVMESSGRVALAATESSVRSFGKAFEATSWAHYRGLQRTRQRRQQLEKDEIGSCEAKERAVVGREWLGGLRRLKGMEREEMEDALLMPAAAMSGTFSPMNRTLLGMASIS